MNVLRARLRREVVVTLTSGTSFRGVLAEQDRRVLVLRNSVLVSGAAGKHVPVDGEVLLMVADVDFVQVLA